jgi:CRISPR-associated protein Cas1
MELARFLTANTRELDFTQPSPNLSRPDNRSIRKRLLSIASGDASKAGIGRSTLHYLRQHAKSERPFKISNKTNA